MIEGTISNLNTPILDIAFNQSAQKLLVITPKQIIEYDWTTRTQIWIFNFQDHFQDGDHPEANWILKHSHCCYLPRLDYWCIQLNNRYIFFIHHSLCYSELINLETKVHRFSYLPYQHDLLFLKHDRRQIRFWSLDVSILTNSVYFISGLSTIVLVLTPSYL